MLCRIEAWYLDVAWFIDKALEICSQIFFDLVAEDLLLFTSTYRIRLLISKLVTLTLYINIHKYYIVNF